MYPYQRLEEEYASFTGSKYSVSCSSGTAALHLALLALGIGNNDEVIVPDFTMAACGFAVSYVGAIPVFVDCDNTLNIDTSLIESKITPKTKAIMAVHIYGRLCNMEEIIRIADKYNLFIIEDACEAQGAVYDSRATITCYSFYKNKIIHAEEGGICTTNDSDLAERMNYLKNMAFSPNHDYFHKEIGYNYRISDAQALLALDSLKNYPKNNKKRQMIKKVYDKHFGWRHLNAIWVYPIEVVEPHIVVENVVGTRYFFKPLSSMPMWNQKVGDNAWKYSRSGVYLPVSETMSRKDALMLCANIDMFL